MVSGKDDFWDLGKLLPTRKVHVPPAPVPIVTAPVESGEEPLRDEDRILHIPKAELPKEEEEYTYIPEDNALITSVTVIRRPSAFMSYHQFRVQAQKYISCEGIPSQPVPFFSYVPQYAHMSEEQKQYYFYWRRCVGEGTFLPCDIAYLYLYFYEIINLPDCIPPAEGARRFATVVAAYHRMHPKILPYAALWLADYCLVHGVPCPTELLRPCLPDILSHSGLKEFYLGTSQDLSRCHVDALMALASDYRWQSSRYAKEDALPLFEAHIPAAIRLVLERLLHDGVVKTPYNKTVRRYDAFCGAVCAGDIKRSIKVVYYSVSHTEHLRQVLTAAVKYAENRLRMHLSVKSRLNVTALPAVYKEIIDAYFAKALPARSTPATMPEYEKQYDAIGAGVNFDDALRIEAASWDNTRLLVTEEELPAEILREEGSMPIPEASIAKADAPPPAPVEEEAAVSVAFLKAVLGRDITEQARVCSLQGRSSELLAAEINELFYDLIGDSVLEPDEDGYRIISDYLEEVTEWIEKNEAR